MAARKHPHLAEKLSQLYSSCIDTSINSNAALAKRLGISRQAISRWTNGSDTSTGDCIPNGQIESVAALFGLEPYFFALELSEFQKRLQRKLALVSSAYLTRPEKLSLSLLPITCLELFGRNHEIDRLNIAWHESKINCLQIVAFGGVGKSSLVNSWLSQLDRDNYAGAKKVYGWSFYCQDVESEAMSSGDFFIQQALQWFGETVSTEDTPWSKANRLANLIRKSKTLLILDALESLQYPPGPSQGTIKNPAVALLIRELAANNNGLCIITSRIAISDLSPFDDGRIQSLELEHLALEDGVKLLSNMGVKGDTSHMVAAVNEYVGHPLCLSLLGSYLSVVYGADISKFRRLESLVDVQSHDAQGSKIVSSYLKWFEGALESSLLNLLGLFDCGVSLSSVKALTKRESIPGLTKELSGLSAAQWGYAVKKLVDANLIFLDDRNNRCLIDCHPLVRDFLGEYIKKEKPDIWKKGNSLIFYYLQSQETASPGTIMQSESLFRAVIHGSRAGLCKEVFQLYFEKIVGGGVRKCGVLSTLH
jgi:transcriptional regulator with XRE-family HTH domain